MLQRTAGIAGTEQKLTLRYREIRSLTEWLCDPLLTEDYGIQSMPDVSPPKWHLAHTTWFFEQFVLAPHYPGFEPFHPAFALLFNSYYNGAGPRLDRARRGLLSRPSVEEVYQYRHATDLRIRELLEGANAASLAVLQPLVTLGLEHERQHQELLLTDIKHILWSNPLRPAYRRELRGVPDRGPGLDEPVPGMEGILSFGEGIFRIGDEGAGEFSFDNERPAHRVFLETFGIQSQPVSCGAYLEFIEAGGYDEPAYWLSEGWEEARRQGWRAPLYWERQSGGWWIYTLSGTRALEEREPVCHLSYFEADAFARWRGLRLPSEAEWERAAGPRIPADANLADTGRFHPEVPRRGRASFFGDAWEWTSSPYGPYPGFRPLEGALGEYNGKFMCSQFVLRGGSCATSAGHLRPTYRNYFPPQARWQFSGARLAV